MSELKSRKYPIAFWVCGCTEIFERLSFYLGRSLILIFVTASVATGGLGLADTTAAKMQADLTAYSYLAGMLGSIFVDRFVGARYTTPIGALIVAVGYYCGSIATDAKLIYAMIFCVALGLGFFKTGAMIGRIVKPEQLNSAYAIRYTLVNAGAFIGTFLTGIFYQNVFAVDGVLGFRPCFRIAALTMVCGAIWFTVGIWLKGGDAGKKPFKKEKTAEELAREAAEKEARKGEYKEKLTTIEKKRIGAIVLISAFQIVFWIFWYLAFLPIYYHWAENMSWKIGSFDIPLTWIDALNSILCVSIGPITAALWTKLSQRPQGDMSLFKKLAFGLSFLGIGYIYFAVLEITRGSSKPSVLFLLFFMILLTLGEMFFSPLGSAFIAEYAPSRMLSIMMSVWGLGIFAAAKLYGYVYSFVFGGRFEFAHACIGIAIVAFTCTILLFVLDKRLVSLVKQKDTEKEANEQVA